jgi:hypothetical protein
MLVFMIFLILAGNTSYVSDVFIYLSSQTTHMHMYLAAHLVRQLQCDDLI